MLLVALASAHTLTFSGDLDVEDTTIATATESAGDETQLFVTGLGGYEASNVLMRFGDAIGPRTSQVPLNGSVESAKLGLSGGVASASGFTLALALLTQDWSEADATWEDAGSGRPWDEAGAAGSSRNGACAEAELESGWGSASVDLRKCVDDWVEGGANHGLVLYESGGVSGVLTIDASEGGSSPKLVVTFDADDADGDGWWPGGVGYDCDDADASRNPGASEVPGNTVDENCDGYVAPATEDTGETTGGDTGDTGNGGDTGDTQSVEPVDTDPLVVTDADGDRLDAALDCNDEDAEVYPGHVEWCDSLDNDCNGRVDDLCVDRDGAAGCACASGGAPGGAALLLPLGLLVRRRRQRVG